MAGLNAIAWSTTKNQENICEIGKTLAPLLHLHQTGSMLIFSINLGSLKEALHAGEALQFSNEVQLYLLGHIEGVN